MSNYIDIYTREQAIKDDVLVDVTEMAKEAGFVIPTCITASVNVLLKENAGYMHQDYDGMLWDILWILYCNVKTVKGKTDTINFEVIIHKKVHTSKTDKTEKFKAVLSANWPDHKPVLTIMLKNED